MATTQAAQSDVKPQQPAATQPSGAPASQPNAPEGQQPVLGTGLGQETVLALLKTLPSFYRVGDPKDAAETLSNMSQSAAPFHHLPSPTVPMYQHYTGMEPGPSTHPRGPPSHTGPPPGSQQPGGAQDNMSDDEGQDGSDGGQDGDKPKGSSGRRSGRSATMSNEEWARQRKDNHKEVERRRRGNINEGINELGRIVPNGSGEKAKGAILARAVQYIHHLKENEARNIEKWTLEKLLMDQAMGDLQAQLEEMKRLWEEERTKRERAESELEVLKQLTSEDVGRAGGGDAAEPKSGSASPVNGAEKTSPKRGIEDVEADKAKDEERKRARVE